MNELALFAGAGGGLLATRWLLGWRTVCAVEIDPYRQAVLLARQADGWLDPFPIWSDVGTFDGRPWRGLVDVVTAGFPCQPFSIAGRRRGAADERNRWPDTIRILCEIRPQFALLENVAALLSDEYRYTVFGDLAEAGFDAEWCMLGASDVGAPHRRKRLWILAYTPREIRQRWTRGEIGLPAQCGQGWWADDPANASAAAESRLGVLADGLADRVDGPGPAAAGAVPRVAAGVPRRPDRLRALGDGQVPACVVAAWNLLTRVDPQVLTTGD